MFGVDKPKAAISALIIAPLLLATITSAATACDLAAAAHCQPVVATTAELALGQPAAAVAQQAAIGRFIAKLRPTATGRSAELLDDPTLAPAFVDTFRLYFDAGLITLDTFAAVTNYLDRLAPGITEAAELLRAGLDLNDVTVATALTLVGSVTNTLRVDVRRHADADGGQLYIIVARS